MAIAGCNPVRLVVAVAILGGFFFAQDQDANDAHPKRNWLACDVIWAISDPSPVGREFSVKLSFHQAPLPNIQVTLTPSGELADASGHPRIEITAVTDSSGTAHFSAVSLGKYTVGAMDGLEFPSIELTVHAKGHFDREIAIEWPLLPLPVRTLRGKLITQTEETDVERPLQPATVELVDLRSSKVLETQSTIGDGSYEFLTIEPGLYVVRVIPPAKDEKTTPASGDIVIELDPAAKQSTIPEMKVEQSECAGVQLLRRAANGRWAP
jgi:hypothetical protein